MREAEFKAWLVAQGYASTSIATWLSDGRKVDGAYGLDEQFDRDGGASILAEMAYSRSDDAAGRPNPSAIDLSGSFYANLAACRAAARAYFRFCETEARPQGRFGELDREAVLEAVAACDGVGDVAQYVAALELGQPTRYWLVLDGTRYPSKAIVRDALARRGSDWLPGGGDCKTALERLGFVVIDWPELNRARDTFLRQMPDFSDFRAAAGAYWDVERAYKNGLIEQAKAIIARSDDDRAVGEALYRLLSVGGSGLPLSWRTLSEVQNADPELRDRFYTTLGVLARSDGPLEEAVPAAARELEALRDAGIAGLRRGEVLSIPITVWATLHPDQASWFKIAKIDEMGRRLFGRRLFPQTEFREADLAEWLQLMRALFGLLDKEFAWHPQDMFDVQGFIWVVGQGKQEEGSHDMEDDEILAKFDVDPRFKAAREAWNEVETAAFCGIARSVHDYGLDWFVVRGPSTSLLRFGIRNQDTVSAEGVIGYVNPAQNELHLNDRYGITPGVSGVFSAIDITDMLASIRPAQQHVANWKRLPLERRPYWPEDYSGPAVAEPERDGDRRPKPTNLILYGPPGTGKTYRTMQEAVRCCGEVPANDRPSLREQYDRLCKERRIEFVTFHQNFSYEEFVEGLRPPSSLDDGEIAANGSNGLVLNIHSGIFRDIAERAAIQRGGLGSTLDSERSIFKVALGDRNHEENEILHALDKGFITLGWGGHRDWSAPQFDDFNAILEHWRREEDPEASGKDSNVEQLYALRSWMQEGDYVVVSDGRDRFRAVGEVTGPYQFHADQTRHPHRRDVRWLWRDDSGEERQTFYPKGFRRHSLYRLDPKAVDWAALSRVVNRNRESADEGSGLPHVLIIDEINRANVSKVFGELITLIEPDKRLGMPNALKVRLPYSKVEFGVPANLHIIGTMNTADRSIALLDTALRRRFRFEEMAPEPELLGKVDGIDLPAVLTAMNRRIEYLVDRDHRIGHAFFIDCLTKAQVDAVMRDKVIPLLQEYFFDDWNRLAAVLGEKDKGGNFLTCDVIEDPMGEGGEPLKSWRVRSYFDEGAYSRLVSARAASPSDLEDQA